MKPDLEAGRFDTARDGALRRRDARDPRFHLPLAEADPALPETWPRREIARGQDRRGEASGSERFAGASGGPRAGWVSAGDRVRGSAPSSKGRSRPHSSPIWGLEPSRPSGAFSRGLLHPAGASSHSSRWARDEVRAWSIPRPHPGGRTRRAPSTPTSRARFQSAPRVGGLRRPSWPSRASMSAGARPAVGCAWKARTTRSRTARSATSRFNRRQIGSPGWSR